MYLNIEFLSPFPRRAIFIFSFTSWDKSLSPVTIYTSISSSLSSENFTESVDITSSASYPFILYFGILYPSNIPIIYSCCATKSSGILSL